MFTISHDYYGILGVSKEATDEEIRSQYRKLMKEHHPDQYKGLRAKYVEMGDEDLLRVIDEKIRQAEEMSKLINEAFEALIDPIKRRQYDDQIYEPAVAKPEIAIHPTKLTFGTLTEGQRKVLSFTIENKGGPVTSVNVDWENTKPDWGELVIEPDPEATFPIKVTVKVDTTGIPSGPKYEKVQVAVDGEVHLVEVYLAVEAVQKVTAPVSSVPPTTPVSPTTKTGRAVPGGVARVVGLGCLGFLVLWAIVSGLVNFTKQVEEREAEAARQTVAVNEQRMLLTVQARAEQVQADATATGVAEQARRWEDVQLLTTNPVAVVEFTWMGDVKWGGAFHPEECDQSDLRSDKCGLNLWARYRIVNKSDVLTLDLEHSASEYSCDNSRTIKLPPGASVKVYCREYSFQSYPFRWQEETPCIQVIAEGMSEGVRVCVPHERIPKDPRPLSSLVQLYIWKRYTGGWLIEGRLGYRLEVDENLPYPIALNVEADQAAGSGSWDIWYREDFEPQDKIEWCYGLRPCRFLAGRTYWMESRIYKWGLLGNEKCVELSAPYFKEERFCVVIASSPP